MTETRKLTFMGAINEAIDQSMEQDENVILIVPMSLVVQALSTLKTMILLAAYLE